MYIFSLKVYFVVMYVIILCYEKLIIMSSYIFLLHHVNHAITMSPYDKRLSLIQDNQLFKITNVSMNNEKNQVFLNAIQRLDVWFSVLHKFIPSTAKVRLNNCLY